MKMMYLNNIIDKYDVLRLNSIQNINELQELYNEILQAIKTIEDKNQPKDKNFLSILRWFELEVLYELETAICSYSESGGA
jgi:hypothetical protein